MIPDSREGTVALQALKIETMKGFTPKSARLKFPLVTHYASAHFQSCWSEPRLTAGCARPVRGGDLEAVNEGLWPVASGNDRYSPTIVVIPNPTGSGVT